MTDTKFAMFDPSHLAADQRRHFFRRAALAPLCLLLVAGLHLVRVWTSNQTPWKGGGFGMFSTVDAESARFLRCYLVTENGRLPLPIPQPREKTVAELRAAPTVAGLQQLAQRLAKHEWRWKDDRQQREAAAVTRAEGLTVTAASLKESSEATSPDPDRLPGAIHALEPVGLRETDDAAIAYAAVEVECWRYRYDRQTGILRSEIMASVSAHRREADR